MYFFVSMCCVCVFDPISGLVEVCILWQFNKDMLKVVFTFFSTWGALFACLLHYYSHCSSAANRTCWNDQYFYINNGSDHYMYMKGVAPSDKPIENLSPNSADFSSSLELFDISQHIFFGFPSCTLLVHSHWAHLSSFQPQQAVISVRNSLYTTCPEPNDGQTKLATSWRTQWSRGWWTQKDSKYFTYSHQVYCAAKERNN